MALVATSVQRLSNLIKREYQPEMAYCRSTVTYSGSADGLAIGNLIGKITSTGKYKVSVETATDGSQVVAGILVGNFNTGSGSNDDTLSILDKGPSSISKAGIIFHSSFDTDEKKAVVYAALEAKGIQVLDPV